MKIILLYITLISALSSSSNQEISNEILIMNSSDKLLGLLNEDDSLNNKLEHSIYGEFLGAGLSGSINYGIAKEVGNDIYLRGTVGFGGVVSKLNPNSAFTIPLSIGAEFRILSWFGLYPGIAGGFYFNYWSLTEGGKDCTGMWNCPPDKAIYLSPFAAAQFYYKRLTFNLKLHAFFSNEFQFTYTYFPSFGVNLKLN